MKYVRSSFVSLLLLLLTGTATADSLLLVHGYLSSAQTWHQSGISTSLNAYGWLYAGNYSARGLLSEPTGKRAKNRFYTLDLPFDAPIAQQSRVLNRIIAATVALHPSEAIILAGHSAGGVVARMSVVSSPHPNVKSLITIASPHIGTPRAAEALDKTDDSGPMSFVKGLVAGDIYHTIRGSRELLRDLLPPNSNNLLGWLNTRQHPDIFYTSIIRNYGDQLMAAYSQDMNQIPTLRGRSTLIPTYAQHELSMQDGLTLISELQRLQKEIGQ